ncbi:amidase family protein [Variovorax terrae]|uniref:Amidase family protein n=1 Tax=Variovorax terrae TaxID=2923278 RepID=A0A9X1W1P4_9BURK|nr:amidase family protein [Variovorax terrae]MCJ0766184.1 amidase family protein [Variovorax terrae]
MTHRQTYAQLREAFRTGDLSPVAVAESTLAHARQVDGDLNIFALLDQERAIHAARESEARWRCGKPLSDIDGMPVSIKEFAAVRGWPSRRGSMVTSEEPLGESAVFVQRIEDAGGVLIGKTRAPEFNWKGVTDSPGYGVTRNPWDRSLTPGGSSGGCAAAVTAGVVRVSMGSDAGGSVRIPAAFTGTLALKPTFGRIPLTPFPSAFHHLPHVGPIAASVSDLSSMMRVVSGPSVYDWTSMGLSDRQTDQPATGLRIGLLAAKHWSESAPAVVEGMQEAVALLREAGFRIEEIDFDVRGASAVGAFLYKQGCLSGLRALSEADLRRIDQGMIEFAHSVANASTSQILEMLQRREIHAGELSRCFDDIDVLMLPTMPVLAFEAGRNTPAGWPDEDWMSWNPFTPAFNATKNPALSFPFLPRGGSLPIGIQWVAPFAREDQLLRLAAWFEDRQPIRLAQSVAQAK